MTKVEELQAQEMERRYPPMSEEEKRAEAQLVLEKEHFLLGVARGG